MGHSRRWYGMSYPHRVLSHVDSKPMSELPAHFYMAPSSSHRWIPCPGSLRACANLPDDEGGEAAARGTLGHHLSEIDLKGEPLDDPERTQLETLSEAERIELEDAVDLCVELVSEMDGDIQLYETKIQSDVIEEHGGTIDVINYDSSNETLHVVDFKFGRIYVEIEGNTQIQCYLNLARQMFPKAKRFFGSIIQPVHSDKMRTAEFTKHQLSEHMTNVVEASGSNRFKAGDHCTFCPYLPQCQTAAKHLRQEIASFPDLTQLIGSVKGPPSDEEVEKLCKIYKTYKLAEKATEGAGDILKRWAREGANVKVHGLGVRTTHRTHWNRDAVDVLQREGLKCVEFLCEPDLMSPKELRDALGMTKAQFEEKFKDALELRPVTSLVMGRDSNDFPEFD